LKKLESIKARSLKNQSTRGATRATVKRVDSVIKLYGERKISNWTTALNLIKGLTSDNKKVYDKAFQKYKDSIVVLKERQPLGKRSRRIHI
jgi:ribosomal protein S20